MKIDLQIEVEHKDGKYPSFDLILRNGAGKDPFMIIRGCRIVNGVKGDFVSYPSRKSEDGKYWNHVWAATPFNDVVLNAARTTAAKPAKKAEPTVIDMESDLPF
jgi:DNA-binding cell septation regulator SpoVG